MTCNTRGGRLATRLYSAVTASVLVVAGSFVFMQDAYAADTAKAGNWPTKPIRIVVPFSPGGSNDHIARNLAQSLSESLGQSVVVENRGGAAGVVGSAVVANADPDGYTYLFVSATFATSAATQNPPYDTLKAFAPVARIAEAPFVMLTRKDFPAKTLPEFIQHAKKNPGHINYGTTGAGDSGHLLTELFSSLSGMKMQQVGYKGVAPAQMDLVAGRLDFMVTTLASINNTPAAQLPKLAFTGAQRVPGYEQIPTVRESTGLDYEMLVWWGMFAPSGTPDPILDKMNGELIKIVNKPEFKVFLDGLGADVSPSSRAEMAEQLKRDVEVFTQTAQRSGLNIAKK